MAISVLRNSAIDSSAPTGGNPQISPTSTPTARVNVPLVVIGAVYHSSAITLTSGTCTDNCSTSYTLLKQSTQVNSGSDYLRVGIWLGYANSDAETNLIASLSGFTDYRTGAIDLSGILASGALDASNDANGTATSALSGATGTLAQPNEIVIVGFTAAAGDITLGDPATGYTNIFKNPTGSTSLVGGGAYKIVSTTSSEQASWTLGASLLYTGCVVTLKDVDAGEGATIPLTASLSDSLIYG